MKIFKLCIKYLIRYKRVFVIYIFMTIIITTIGIISPYIIGDFLDVLISNNEFKSVINYCIFFSILNLLRIFLSYISSLIYIKMQVEMGYEFNRDIIIHVQDLPLSFIKQNDSAYLNQLINNDCNDLVIFCITILQNVIINSLTLIIPFIALLTINCCIAFLFIFFLVAYIVLYSLCKKPLYKTNFLFKENQSKYFASLFEQFSYINLIKINSIQPEINKRLDTTFANILDAATNRQKINYLFTSMDNFVSTIAQISFFILGGMLIIARKFTIGKFTIFSSYFNMMMNSIRYFFNLGATYQNILVSYNRITSILAIDKEKKRLKKT